MSRPFDTFHGKPCIRCAATLRYLSSKGCVACFRKRSKENYQRHVAYVKALEERVRA